MVPSYFLSANASEVRVFFATKKPTPSAVSALRIGCRIGDLEAVDIDEYERLRPADDGAELLYDLFLLFFGACIVSLNTKSECRNPKQAEYRNSNVPNIRISDFDIVSDFGFRASALRYFDLYRLDVLLGSDTSEGLMPLNKACLLS